MRAMPPETVAAFRAHYADAVATYGEPDEPEIE